MKKGADTMNLPKHVSYIIETLNKNNYEAFVVGGCVRDSIMGKTPKDFDITTSATPLEIKNTFAKTVDTGIKHGTITVILEKYTFEVTTYRIDGKYIDGRRPEDVCFTNSLEEDLKRRDFTINAIAYHNEIGYIDPFNGIGDIKQGYIRGVGVPDKRFKEDALRMLRCIRFSTQLGFNIEIETFKALENNANLISQVSIERIRDELSKAFVGDYLHKINLLVKSKIIAHINTSLNEYLECNLKASITYMKKADKNIVDRLVILFRYLNNKEVKDYMKFLKYSNKDIKVVDTLIRYLHVEIKSDKYSIKKVMSQLGTVLYFKLISIKELLGQNTKNILYISQDIIKNKEPLTLKELNINGTILKDNKICENKQIGELLNYLLDNVLKNPKLNSQEILLSLGKKYFNN